MFVTYRTYDAQFKQIKNQELPNLKILSINSIKSDTSKSPSLYDGSYCRIVKGSTISKEIIPEFDFNNEQIERGFINEIESHIGNSETYFTYFGNNPYLMITHASSKENFIVDHSNVVIKLHNYGSTISALSIESFTAYYKPESNIEPITFQGNINNKITLTPEENENFVLHFDEVTTDLNNSLCKIKQEDYVNIPNDINLLKTHMTENMLQYNKLEIKLHCWDLFNNETVFKITIEHNGNFFISYTSILD